MNVSAIIVTRGDVSLLEVMDPMPDEWEKLVWVNGSGLYRWREDIWGGSKQPTRKPFVEHRVDLSVYGRYHAIQYASHDLIYVQDDDCVVSDPQAIVDEWMRVDEFRHVQGKKLTFVEYADYVVCNMPQEFRHAFYTDHALVGFGAAFHRDAPERAFSRFALSSHKHGAIAWGTDGVTTMWFNLTCDIVFTGLTSRVLVDVPKENLPWAHWDDRMWRQPDHLALRAQMRELMLAAQGDP